MDAEEGKYIFVFLKSYFSNSITKWTKYDALP